MDLRDDPRNHPAYAGRCPHCNAAALMVNCSWAECIAPRCRFPYSINGVWVEDVA